MSLSLHVYFSFLIHIQNNDTESLFILKTQDYVFAHEAKDFRGLVVAVWHLSGHDTPDQADVRAPSQ